MSERRSTHAPPALALRILEHRLRGQDGEVLLGDLLEAFADPAAQQRTRFARNLRFWRETLVALWVYRPRPVTQPSGDSLMRAFAGDVRHAFRLLRRAPGFTLLCVLTLGLGIGATTAVFSVVNPVLLRDLPYPSADRIVTVWERDPGGERSNVGWMTARDVTARARRFEATGVIGGWEPTLTGDGSVASERLTGQRVSSGFFDVLGVRPAFGRGITAENDIQGNHRVVVLAHEFWRRRFGGDSTIVGRTIPLDDIPHTVVGVMPATFDNVLEPDAQIWRALGYEETQPWACRTCRHLRLVARMRDGVAVGAAEREADAILRALAAEHVGSYTGAGASVVGLQEQVTRAVRPVLAAVTGATVLVLLIALANVANLQLARAVRREEEFAIRTALGAGRGRLTRQLLAEGLVIAVLSGIAGLMLAWAALRMLLARLPGSLPRVQDVGIDGTVLLLALGVTLLLGIIIGVVPAWRQSAAGPFQALRASGRTAASSRRAARAVFVVTEVALALMLLVGAGLLGRTMVELMRVDAGFDPRNLLTLRVQSTGSAYPTSAATFAHHDRLRRTVGALPGVRHVALASQLPLGGMFDKYGIRAQDKPLANEALAPSADRYLVSPGFLEAMRVPLVRGRALTAADDDSTAAPVLIVNEALAAEIWPGENAIGKRVQVGGVDAPWREVIGVVGNVRHHGLDDRETRQVYIPERQWFDASTQMVMVVRTTADPAALASTVREAVRSLDPAQPIVNVATMEQLVARSTAQRRFALMLFATFGAVALVLASAGIYGVLSGRVAERTREIGLRSALGAAPTDIVRMIVREGALLTAVGMVVGVAGAITLARFLGALLYGVRPVDPTTLAGVLAALTVVALAACLIPALRALRIDPMAALRAE